MVFPLTKMNKEEALLRPSNAYYTEEYAQKMCSLHLTDELNRTKPERLKGHTGCMHIMSIARKKCYLIRFIARNVVII